MSVWVFKMCPLGEELFPQFREVVDFAVVNDPDRAVLVRDGLLTGVEIDDGEPAVTEHRLPIDVDPVIIRTAVDDQTHHAAHDLCINCGCTGTDCDFSGDPTHKFSDLLEVPTLPAWTTLPSEVPIAAP